LAPKKGRRSSVQSRAGLDSTLKGIMRQDSRAMNAIAEAYNSGEDSDQELISKNQSGNTSALKQMTASRIG